MDHARHRLDELVAFGAGLQLQNWSPSDEISEAPSQRFSRGQFDHSKYLNENAAETENPQAFAEFATVDRRADARISVLMFVPESFSDSFEADFLYLQDVESRALHVLDDGVRWRDTGSRQLACQDLTKQVLEFILSYHFHLDLNESRSSCWSWLCKMRN